MKLYSFRQVYFFPLFLTLLAFLAFPLCASDDEEDLEREEQRPQSLALVAMNTVLGNDNQALQELERGMVNLVQNSVTVLSTHRQAVNPLDVDRGLRQNITDSREGLTRAEVILDQINQHPAPAFQGRNTLGRIHTLASLDAFLTAKGIRVVWGQTEGQIQTLVHNQHRGNPSFNASYSGTVGYSGNQSYSGSTSYSGSQYYSGTQSYSGSKYYSGSVSVISCSHSSCWSCGIGGRRNNDHGYSGYAPYSGSVSYSGSVPYSGYTSYSGSVPYSGNTSYSGSHTVTCTQDHHACQCQDWAQMILSFREVLEQKDFYKQAYEQQKTHLDRLPEASAAIRNINTNLQTVETDSNRALVTYREERGGVDSLMEKVQLMAQMASSVMQNRESYHTTIRTILIEKEEEQQKENDRLQRNLERLQKEREEREEQIKADEREQKRLNEEKLERIEEKKESATEKLNQALRDQVALVNEKAEEKQGLIIEKYDLKNQLTNEIFQLKNQIEKDRNKLTNVDIRTRSILRMIALNIEDKDKRKSYMDASRNNELSLLDLLAKIEDYYC